MTKRPHPLQPKAHRLSRADELAEQLRNLINATHEAGLGTDAVATVFEKVLREYNYCARVTP